MDSIKLFTENRFRANVLAGHNIRIIGHTGVGKTTRCVSLLSGMGLRTVVLAAPNTDPFLRLGGLPHVTVLDHSQFLKFVRSPDIEQMQVLYIDEFARGTREFHQQAFEILNAVAGTGRLLMGIPVPNLLSVITTDNPAEDDSVRYDVAVLEHAIETRFHVHLWMEGSPSSEWLGGRLKELADEWAARGVKPEKKSPSFIARCLVSWWNEALDEEGKLLISPRVLEFMGRQVLLGDDPGLAVPFGVKVPIHLLREKLSSVEVIDWDMMMSNPDRVREIVEEDPGSVVLVAELLRQATVEQWSKCRDLISLVPFDLRVGILNTKENMQKVVESFGGMMDTATLLAFYRWMHSTGTAPSPITYVAESKEETVNA